MPHVPRTLPEKSLVGVVLVQSGDSDDPGLARLITQLAAAGAPDPPVVVVDQRRPGRWSHETSARLVHLGGSAEGGEPAAVAAAAQRLAERFAPELILVARSGLEQLDARVLALLDDYALATASRTPAALAGAGVASADEPLPVLLVLPAEVAGRLGGEPAPGSDLRAGLDASGLPVLDLALVRRLRDQSVPAGALPREALVLLTAKPAARPAAPVRTPDSFWIDEVYVPETVPHGEKAPLVVRGWVVATPMPRRVVVRIDGGEALGTDVSVRRPDVLASHPLLEHEACGFDLRGEIGPLAPGTHRLEWTAVGTELRRDLGTLRVLPVHRLEVQRVHVPERAAPGEAAPVRIEGRVVSSDPSPALDVRAAGRPLRVRTRALPPPGEGRPGWLEFVAAGRVEPGEKGAPLAFDLEVRSLDRTDVNAWTRRVELPVERGGGAALEERWVGEHDPRLGGTPVRIRGVLFDARASQRVALASAAGPLAEALVTPLETGDPSLPVVAFSIESEALAGLPAGEHQLRIVAGAEAGGRVVASWREHVRERTVVVRAGAARVSAPDPGSGLRRLVLEGELESADLVHSLALAIGGTVRSRLGGEWLSPAMPVEGAAANVHRFRFDVELLLQEGTVGLEVRVRRAAEEVTAWSGELVVPSATPPAARVRCAELDRLLREDPAPVWSRIVLEGEVVGGAPGAAAVLRLDGQAAARAALGPDRRFRLEARPAPGRTVRGRLEIEAGGALLSRSPEFRAAVRPLLLAGGAEGRFSALVDRLLPGGVAALPAPPAEVLLRMLERSPGTSASLLAAIADLEERAREAERRPAVVIEGEAPLPERRLSVLLACWEVPCSRHGGGVCMVNLLRHLGQRHAITLLHALAPGEEGLSEEVRPYVREILTVRREWRESAEGAGFGVPHEHALNASPRVREVVEAELATGVYDLVNYEFNPMVLHASEAPLPALGVLHEVHSFARASVLPRQFADAEAAAAALAGVVESLHFETTLAPRAFRELAALTREEAEFLGRWLPGARLFVSSIPVDVERFAAAAAERPDGPPTFVFVGNYVHPPNREAARLLASRVAPAALALRPDLRFVIAGPNPPDELRELARPPAIEVAGFVPDLEGLLARATAFVAPIVSGGGLRVKLLEAMAGGCAVVSTPLGLNGIPAEPGREVVRVAAVEEFAGVVLRLADDPAFARRVGAAGRALVDRTFGITAQGERRERIWRAVLDAAPQR
jgi:glycosyltransferase involved in cell wall biosynthesis